MGYLRLSKFSLRVRPEYMRLLKIANLLEIFLEVVWRGIVWGCVSLLDKIFSTHKIVNIMSMVTFLFYVSSYFELSLKNNYVNMQDENC